MSIVQKSSPAAREIGDRVQRHAGIVVICDGSGPRCHYAQCVSQVAAVVGGRELVAGPGSDGDLGLYPPSHIESYRVDALRV